MEANIPYIEHLGMAAIILGPSQGCIYSDFQLGVFISVAKNGPLLGCPVGRVCWDQFGDRISGLLDSGCLKPQTSRELRLLRVPNTYLNVPGS